MSSVQHQSPPSWVWGRLTAVAAVVLLLLSVSSVPAGATEAGVEWTIRTSAADIWWESVTYGNGLFVAVSRNGTGTGTNVMTSPDGITWTSQTPPTDYT